MPVYSYKSVHLPDGVEHILHDMTKVARINYVKKIGPEPAKWIVGLGYFIGNRFVLEEEYKVEELVIKAESYGIFAVQEGPDGTMYDRGWILVPYRECRVEGNRCTLL